MKNLLNSTEIATLSRQRVKHTQVYWSCQQIFKIRSSDAGRPFTDLVNDLNYLDMGRMHET
jgi:two-component system CheB/CheR fusion protein